MPERKAPQRLTEKEHWESAHSEPTTAASVVRRPVPTDGRLAAFISRALFEDYANWVRWERLYPRFLPTGPSIRALEIGSAPGHHLVELHRRYGYDVFGIEYSDSGVELNRQVFAAHGLQRERVIHADFFAPELLELYRTSFDVVISRGFIEHFSDPELVVERHLEFLAPGGVLVVTIPNLRGLNRALTTFFQRELLSLHNVDIMGTRAFRRLFDHPQLVQRFCRPYGTFSFRIFETKPDAWVRPFLVQARRLQLVLNVIFRAVLRGRGFDTSWTSPYYMYVGTKRKPGAGCQA